MRPSWDQYFMDFAHAVSTRATCDRKHVGAVAVMEKRIICSGYNGSIVGQPHCDDAGHDLVKIDGRDSCIRTLHAEVNLVAQAALHGTPLRGATVYVNTFPCWNCAKLMLAAGIRKVVYDDQYFNDPRVANAFELAGATLMRFQAKEGS